MQKAKELNKIAKKAMKWLHRSADQGHGLAYYNLGFEYSSGALVRKNELEAINGIKKR